MPAGFLHASTHLAQTGTGISLGLRAAIGIGLILLVAVLGGWVIGQTRRRLLRRDDGGVSGAGFTLADLRQMRRDGRLSEQEYDRAKARLVGRVHDTLRRTAPPGSGTPPAPEPKE